MGIYKYIRYTAVLLFTVFRKVFGLVWYYVAVPFRAYARNVVYNYVLQNRVYLKRLWERPLNGRVPGHFKLDGVEIFCYVIDAFHGTEGGYIKYRKIHPVEYHLVYWVLWGWLDDDANQDTTDKGYVRSIVEGERLAVLPRQICVELKKDLTEFDIFGNSFDLGDRRAEHPIFEFWSSTLWNVRNTAYNFKYMQWEENRPEMLFYHKVGEFQFGYRRDGRLVFGMQ